MSYWEFDDLRREAEAACERYGPTTEGQARALRHLWSRDVVELREARYELQRRWIRTLTRKRTV